MSFETRAVIIQIPAAPERTLSRSKGRMARSITDLRPSFWNRSLCQTSPRIENLHVVGGGINAGSLLMHSCKKEWLEEHYYAKDGEEWQRGGYAAGATRLPSGRGARGKRSEIHPYRQPWIQLDQNVVFFIIRTNPRIFVCM